MELLIWHEALGSEDEQATEDELLARLLYAHVADEDATRHDSDAHSDSQRNNNRIQALQFIQALVAFTRLLRQAPPPLVSSSSTTTNEAPPASSASMSATLNKRRFLIREVEPQIYMALGVPTAELHGDDLRAVHDHVLEDIYAMFCLFYGSIDQQLRRRIPTEKRDDDDDGMALLLRIATLRKQLRKIAIAQELQDHDDAMAFTTSTSRLHPSPQQRQLKQLETELETLLANSPSRSLWRHCASFFPTLLRVMQVQRLSLFHAIHGVAYFPMDEPTCLALQTLVHTLERQLETLMDSVVLFYKGSLLWSSSSSSNSISRTKSSFLQHTTLRLLLRFLQLREQDGMDVDLADPNADSDSDDTGHLWMEAKYDDAFSPVWASKTTHAECAVTQHVAPQPRHTRRSLHKQTSSSSLSAIVRELSEATTSGNRSSACEQLLLRRAQRYRSDGPVYRNRGFLTSKGYFLPSWELSKAVKAQETVWAPRVFTSSSQPTEPPRTSALLYHDSDLSVLLLVKQEPVTTPTTTSPTTPTITPQQLEQIETVLDKLQLSAMAADLGKQYASMHGKTTSREKPIATQPMFVYLDHVNGALTAPQIPRLIKTKDDDLQPRPSSLWAHYFPPSSLELLNDAFAALHSDPTTVELRVKTQHEGWLVARHASATQRELFAFFDTKVASVADAQDAVADLLDSQFSKILI